MNYELKPIFDDRKSFYGKAYVNKNDEEKTLYSYNVKILKLAGSNARLVCSESDLTMTTCRHIREFLKQNLDNNKKWTKKEILKLM